MNRGFDMFSINQINSHLVANGSILEIKFPLSLLTWIFFLSKNLFFSVPPFPPFSLGVIACWSQLQSLIRGRL